MNMTHLTDDVLLRIVAQHANGAYRENSPFWKAAIQARRELIKRGVLMPDTDETQEAPRVPREAYED